MLLIFNERGNIEEGFLEASNRSALMDYRDSLITETVYNYDKNVEEVIRTLTNEELYEKIYRGGSYVDGKKLIHESYLNFWGYTVPFSLYLHRFQKVSTKCNNLITIEILTRILKDYYNVADKKLISEFVKVGLMRLHLEYPDYSYNHHIGMENLMNPDAEKDLRSFRNSFPFLEYVVSKEYTFEELSKMGDNEIKEHQLGIPLNVIASNTQILFGDSIKTLKKVKRI